VLEIKPWTSSIRKARRLEANLSAIVTLAGGFLSNRFETF
jgi:hypothetical protein